MAIIRGLRWALVLVLPVAAWAYAAGNADDLDQTITFTLPPQVTAGTTATLHGVASSGLPVSFTSLTSLVCTVAGNQVTYLTAGSCQIRADQPGNAQYEDANPVTGTTTVIAATSLQPQTLAFTLPAQAAPGGTATLPANATSGLPVSYTSSTPTVCTVTGTTVSFLTAGTCTIVGNQPGNQTYLPAQPVTQTITVAAPGLQPQTINFTLPAQSFPGANVVLSGTATSGLPVTYTSSTPAVCSITNNTVNFLTPGTCTVIATQAGNQTFAAATAVSQFTIVVAAVPTLGEWGMLGLSGLIIMLGMSQLRQRSEHGV